jgi:hypothetical protein
MEDSHRVERFDDPATVMALIGQPNILTGMPPSLFALDSHSPLPPQI